MLSAWEALDELVVLFRALHRAERLRSTSGLMRGSIGMRFSGRAPCPSRTRSRWCARYTSSLPRARASSPAARGSRRRAESFILSRWLVGSAWDQTLGKTEGKERTEDTGECTDREADAEETLAKSRVARRTKRRCERSGGEEVASKTLA